MELIVTVTSEDTLKTNADSFLVGTLFGLRNKVYDLEGVKHLRSLTDKTLYVNMDRIIHEEELDEAKAFFTEVVSFADGVYVSDMAYMTFANELGVMAKIIYNPSTLVTNVSDVAFFESLGMKRVCISPEITIDNMIEIMNEHEKVEVLIHGYLNMFYSKRTLLTNYFDYIGQDVQYEGTLIEEERTEPFPVVEDYSGSHVFTGLILASFKEWVVFDDISVRVDGFLIEEEQHHFTIDLYDKLRNYEIDTKEATVMYGKKYDLRKLFDGYYYKKTVYEKTEAKI